MNEIWNMMDINVGSLQCWGNVLIKITSVGAIKNGNMSNKELAEELQKIIIRKFSKRKDR